MAPGFRVRKVGGGEKGELASPPLIVICFRSWVVVVVRVDACGRFWLVLVRLG